MLIVWILGFSILGSIGAIAGAALLLAVPTVVRDRLVPLLISYATGTLLGAAFLFESRPHIGSRLVQKVLQ